VERVEVEFGLLAVAEQNNPVVLEVLDIWKKKDLQIETKFYSSIEWL
jgi:hypothetical protein